MFPFSRIRSILLVITQLSLCKVCVYLSVAYPVKEHRFPAAERAGDQMMSAGSVGEGSFAKRAISGLLHNKLYYTGVVFKVYSKLLLGLFNRCVKQLPAEGWARLEI